MRRLLLAVAAALGACDGTSDLQISSNGSTGAAPPPVVGGAAVPLGPEPIPFDPAAIPSAEPFLPPLAGHRLAVEGTLAVVSDPEGAQADGRAPMFHVVDLAAETSRQIVLPDGARPGAVEIDSGGRHAWAVLEGSGGLALLDLQAARVIRFFPVCQAPVDLAFLGSNIWVACMNGEVVRFTGPDNRRIPISGVPVRIAASNGAVHVALSDATLVQLDEQGNVQATSRPEVQPLVPTTHNPVRRDAVPNTPRRLIPMPSGQVALLHQQSVEGELVDPEVPAPSPYSGAAASPRSCPTPATRDAFTLGNSVGTRFGFTGSHFLGTTLPLDAAVSPVTGKLAIADGATGRVAFMNPQSTPAKNSQGCPVPNSGDSQSLNVPGVSSIAYDASGRLVSLSADKHLTVLVSGATMSPERVVVLRPRNVPVGFTIFHSTPAPMAATSPNVACASCHPAGLNNGGTLQVNGVKRKVMTLGTHLRGATGVHWDNQPFQDAVVVGTWKNNMQGRALTAAEATSLREYIEQLRPPAMPTLAAEKLELGRLAFGKASCGGCHDPSKQFTNNSQANVGRGMHRVPSLVGLAYSAPYMADGCAKTLEERFSNVACGGGEQHGRPSLLTADELDALIAYLKTL